MPKRATPTGRPMASTEPNETIRITMAKARPMISLEGSSNSAKPCPPISTCRPSSSGALASRSAPTSWAADHGVSSGSSMSA